MTKGWWASDNGEDYRVGPCASRDEAIQTAQDEDCGYDYDFNEKSGHHKVTFCVALCESGDATEDDEDYAPAEGIPFRSVENEEWLTFLADGEGDRPPYRQIDNNE